MSKKKQPPICPYAVPYEDMKRDRRGRKPSNPEAMRRQMAKALDLMLAAGGLWTLATVRRLLVCLTLFDDAALNYSLALMHLNDATDDQMDKVGRLISAYLCPLPRRKENR